MSQTTFQQYLESSSLPSQPATEEVLAFVLPLFEEVQSFHEQNRVAPFEQADSIFLTDGRLDVDETRMHAPKLHLSAVEKLIQRNSIHGYSITGRLSIEEDVSNNNIDIRLEQLSDPEKDELKVPVYLPGYQCYEMRLGHHDTQTDIFCLGLILGSVVMGVNLYHADDLNQFVAYRNQPTGINPRIHPTVAGLVTEMTELDRRHRSRDLAEIIERLIHYRDYDAMREVDLAKLADLNNKKNVSRKEYILHQLRTRLFDTSRRNRLLYYKPNARFVNLTVSSVPMVLHFQRINPQHLFTWNAEISKKVIAQNDISLNRYLRFEDHPYLSSQLNGIRQQSENDRKEYGFTQLKLVIAFLHWHNLKEAVNERIQSPLLLIPVEIEKKKALKEERFTLRITDNTALVNPILANHLKDLYGIQLPETVSLDETSMNDFFLFLQSKIAEAREGVKLNYIDQPRIRIIHNIARQTINNYRRRLRQRAGHQRNAFDYSYSEENYKPLGLEMFRQRIEPKMSSLEFLLADKPGTASFRYSSLTEEKTSTNFELTDGEENPYSWDFDICNIVLGNFNYKKMSLVSDYNSLIEQGTDHEVFNKLFSSQPRTHQQSGPAASLPDIHHVISADPTQTRAVMRSRNGQSYIIQGPPGTGKSQTITNLIADFLARGKTVLFVCEKRAALDVVYHRLQQNRLSDLCCYIHDSQNDKKEFYRDLKTVYDDHLNNRQQQQVLVEQRTQLIQRLQQSLELLQQYQECQLQQHPDTGVATRQLIERLIPLRQYLPPAMPAGDIPAYRHWVEFGDIIQQLGRSLEETGAEPVLALHPFSNLGIPVLKAANPFTQLDNLASQAIAHLQQLEELIQQQAIPAVHTASFVHLKNLIDDSALLAPLAASRNLRLVNTDNQEAREFDARYQQYQRESKEYREALEQTSHWKAKFDRTELPRAVEIAKQQEKSFLRFLSGDWRRLKKQMEQSYDFSAHQLKPAYQTLLQQLQQEYDLEHRVSSTRSELENLYRISQLDTAYLGIEVLRRKRGDQEIDFLLGHPQADQLVLQLSQLHGAFQELEQQLSECLFDFSQKSIPELKDELATLQNNSGALRELLPTLQRFSTVALPFQKFVRNTAATPQQTEALLAQHSMTTILNTQPRFAATNAIAIRDIVNDIENTYNELLSVNSRYIRAIRQQVFLQNYDLSNTSATVLSPEQKQLKKAYTEGRKVLEREMNKSMRFRSIREIASNESGAVLKDIKPVWLMSPLSVSDSLPLDTKYFDVVIFDEASQITLEEGIPALYRAPQAIIVGDEKQMPPSNFFMARADDPEDLELVEGESKEEILSADADSLLVQGARKLDSTMLSWHYRSRYETLISYSNHAFYGAELLTIPDKTIHHYEKELLTIKDPVEGRSHASLLLRDSLSYHYMPDNVYEDRGNIGEAKYIAELVRSLLLAEAKESIGVVAFSQEQQGVIEEAMDQLSATDKAFEEALEKAFNRNDEGQFTGLFVKNLENVQGDERDIIIMSVCYGHDSRKKMLMNFGPINRKGGEKRLNVIFSRARKHMAVISSIRHFHITNEYNDGANYFKRFLHYVELVSTGNMSMARTILDSLTGDQQRSSSASSLQLSVIARELKAELLAAGYEVDEQVGQSSFKCSLAVKKNIADPSYSLGILIDDDQHYHNEDLIEQYFQRPAILKSFGWNLLTVFAKDWLQEKQLVLDRVRQLLEKRPEPAAAPSLAPATEAVVVEESPAVQQLLSPGKDRFWQVTQVGVQLHIRTGKPGTNGLVQVKSYASEAEAAATMEQLLAEKREEGYL